VPIHKPVELGPGDEFGIGAFRLALAFP